MKKLSASLLALMYCLAIKAQYITIPDTTFVAWLQSQGYSQCMNGNQLDTTCNAVVNANTLNCYAIPIHDLTGVEYFKNLGTLDCSNDSLYSIPGLPPQLQYLNCALNNLSSLPALPASLTHLDCQSNQLSSMTSLPASLTTLYCNLNLLNTLPPLPASLNNLDCSANQLSSLPILPASLNVLYCSANYLSSLPALPDSLFDLNCSSNQLNSLPALPDLLTLLQCQNNQLSSLPSLPVSLISLTCAVNQLSGLPNLPVSLNFLWCEFNQLDSLPALPTSLNALLCGNNQLSSMPVLPTSLTGLYCSYNQLSSLPTLPPLLRYLDCAYNQLSGLPSLPASLATLDCYHNQLSTLPALPDSMFTLNCSYNPTLGCLPELGRIVHFIFDSTNISCLPNYSNITNSSPALNTVPLCGIYNSNGCQYFRSISGQCFYDSNNNCIFDNTDSGTNYVKAMLYSGSNLLEQVFSGGQGFYSFDLVPYGSYKVQIDTANLPFTVACPDTAYFSVSLSPADSLSYNNNFAFQCRTMGFDIGVYSILRNWVEPRPNALITLNTTAGDLSQLYGAQCALGISGQVQITFSGQVSYVGPAAGALSPTLVNGNIITWNIADFGNVNIYSAFNLLFNIDSLASPGTQLCFNVSLSPINGDYNAANNNTNYCVTVVNSLDPNEKEVSPSGSMDTSSHWLTYTIRFQNTGTADALNIKVADTLDSNLDPATFQLLNYSHKNLTQIFGNVVLFNFPNINLPDSATSDSASRGYVQYRIKLRDNLPIGTQIQNTAYIYFDFNNAVATNTTLNTINVATGINANAASIFNFRLYPNPAANYVTIETQNIGGGNLQLMDITGRELHSFSVNNKIQLSTADLSNGLYVLRFSNKTGASVMHSLVINK